MLFLYISIPFLTCFLYIYPLPFMLFLYMYMYIIHSLSISPAFYALINSFIFYVIVSLSAFPFYFSFVISSFQGWEFDHLLIHSDRSENRWANSQPCFVHALSYLFYVSFNLCLLCSIYLFLSFSNYSFCSLSVIL